MALFFISYDLMTPGKDYQRLYDKLAALGAQRVLLSLWAVRGNAFSRCRDWLKVKTVVGKMTIQKRIQTWAEK